MIELPTNANLKLSVTNNLNNKAGNLAEYLDLNDLRDTFKINLQLNSAYEISFTATYTDQYKEAYNLLKAKRGILFNNQTYYVQQLSNTTDENGMDQLQVTATAMLIDRMKNVRIDPAEPTEDHPDIDSDSSDDNSDDQQQDPQPGTITVKKTDEQQTYTLQDRLDQFFNNNDQGIKYELHGNFPQAAVDCKGSLYEWLGSNLATFGAYYVPDNYVLKIYDIASLRHKTDHEFRYLHNTSTISLQTDATSMVNCCEVYGGKMEKDITSVSGGGNGITEPINGDWTQVMQNAASLVGEKLSDGDIANIKNRIRIESGGNETSLGGTDGLNDGRATGLLQFKPGTFNYYCRPPYTDIMKGLDQLIAMMNIPDWRDQISGNSGWSPHGAPISKDTITAKPADDNSWGWPFPCGEGTFSGGQLFGVHPGGEFRPNGFHDGLDFGSIDHPGNEVHAIHGGKVTTAATWGGSEIKWYLVITDSSGLNVEYQEAFSSQNNIIVGYGQEVHTGDVIGYRTTDHLHIGITRMDVRQAFGHAFSNDGTWLDPQAMIKSGGNASPGGDSSDVTTTTQTYYALHYTYRDEDSIAKYGLQKGPPITMDSIYDMNALQQYIEQTVQHDPPTTLTVSNVSETDFNIGDVWHLVAPELNLDTDVTLMGINYNPYNPSEDASVTFNNTGLDMKNSIYAMAKDIKQMNHNVDNFDIYGSVGARKEDHFSGIDTSQNKDSNSSMKFSPKELEAIKQFTDS